MNTPMMKPPVPARLAPPVYRPPAPVRAAAPPVYRPQPAAQQRKPSLNIRPPVAQQRHATPISPGRRLPASRVVQPLILTIFKKGEKHGGLLDIEIDVLSTGYADKRQFTLNDDTRESLRGKLKAARSDEILVINAHGIGGTVAGRSAREFATLLHDAGAVGYKEIHLYVCQAGLSLFDFDQELSRILDTPVWAPRGNVRYNDQKQQYGVRRMRYDAQKNEWVPLGEEEYHPSEGWWYSVQGRTTGMGRPPVPHAFPEPPPVYDLSQFKIEVVSSGFGKK